jgi:hypothetical protein
MSLQTVKRCVYGTRDTRTAPGYSYVTCTAPETLVRHQGTRTLRVRHQRHSYGTRVLVRYVYGTRDHCACSAKLHASALNQSAARAEAVLLAAQSLPNQGVRKERKHVILRTHTCFQSSPLAALRAILHHCLRQSLSILLKHENIYRQHKLTAHTNHLFERPSRSQISSSFVPHLQWNEELTNLDSAWYLTCENYQLPNPSSP